MSWRRKMRLTFRRFPQLVQAPRTGPSRPPSGQPCRGKGRALQSACDGPGPPGAVLLRARAPPPPRCRARPWPWPWRRRPPGPGTASAARGAGLLGPAVCLSLSRVQPGPRKPGTVAVGSGGGDSVRSWGSPQTSTFVPFCPSTSPWGLVSRPRKERASGPRGRAHGVGRRAWGGWRHAGLRPQPGSVPSGGSGRLLTRRPGGPAVPIGSVAGWDRLRNQDRNARPAPRFRGEAPSPCPSP